MSSASVMTLTLGGEEVEGEMLRSLVGAGEIGVWR